MGMIVIDTISANVNDSNNNSFHFEIVEYKLKNQIFRLQCKILQNDRSDKVIYLIPL